MGIHKRKTQKLLLKNMEKYIHLVTSRSKNNVLKGKIEIYRNLVRYLDDLEKVVDDYEQDLLDLDKLEIYFPEDTEKVVKIGNEILILPMDSEQDFKRANKQVVREQTQVTE